MKFYICPYEPDVVAAENIYEAKKIICGSCKFNCNGPKEVASFEIPMIKASKNLLINIGNYIHETKACIQALISAIDNSNYCETCSDEFGTSACSECPWHQAKSRALELLKEVE